MMYNSVTINHMSFKEKEHTNFISYNNKKINCKSSKNNDVHIFCLYFFLDNT